MSDLIKKLNELRGKVTDQPLHKTGRYFDRTCHDLTSCHHGDTGNYRNDDDGKAIAVLWNAWLAGEISLTPTPQEPRQ